MDTSAYPHPDELRTARQYEGERLYQLDTCKWAMLFIDDRPAFGWLDMHKFGE